MPLPRVFFQKRALGGREEKAEENESNIIEEIRAINK
jgi:hypothetical protein